MRLTPLVAVLVLFASPLAAAQDRVPVEKRVDSLEKQMRSVQRRVFQPGSPQLVQVDALPVAAPSNNAVSDLAQRVDALERSLTTLTGQMEENTNRIRTIEEETRRNRADADARLGRIEAGRPPAAAAQITAEPSPAVSSSAETSQAPSPTSASIEPDPVSTDPAENVYLSGFRLWESKRYDEAEGVLKSVAAQYPKHRRASWARNLLGRAYLDDNKPATAAEAFLSNYQTLPQGERAPDSLYYLGDALMRLKKPEQACKVYDELSDVYGSTMRDFLKQNLPAARKQAKCG